MVDGHSKIKGRQHGTEFNDEFAIIEEFVYAFGVARAERASHGPLTRAWSILCPTLGTKQCKRKCKEREYPLEHDRTSSCVAGSESRRGQPGIQETEGSAK
jgi:hypothetical protein